MCSIHWPEPVAAAPVRRRQLVPAWAVARSARATAGAPADAAAARAFYRDALGGRQVWPTDRDAAGGSLWFVVCGTLIEVGSAPPRSREPVALAVDDPDELAGRCWDAGFSVRVRADAAGRVRLSVIDPFGRPIELFSQPVTTRPRALAAEGRR